MLPCEMAVGFVPRLFIGVYGGESHCLPGNSKRLCNVDDRSWRCIYVDKMLFTAVKVNAVVQLVTKVGPR